MLFSEGKTSVFFCSLITMSLSHYKQPFDPLIIKNVIFKQLRLNPNISYSKCMTTKHTLICPIKVVFPYQSTDWFTSSKLNLIFQNANGMDREMDLQPVTASRRRS